MTESRRDVQLSTKDIDLLNNLITQWENQLPDLKTEFQRQSTVLNAFYNAKLRKLCGGQNLPVYIESFCLRLIRNHTTLLFLVNPTNTLVNILLKITLLHQIITDKNPLKKILISLETSLIDALSRLEITTNEILQELRTKIAAEYSKDICGPMISKINAVIETRHALKELECRKHQARLLEITITLQELQEFKTALNPRDKIAELANHIKKIECLFDEKNISSEKLYAYAEAATIFFANDFNIMLGEIYAGFKDERAHQSIFCLISEMNLTKQAIAKFCFTVKKAEHLAKQSLSVATVAKQSGSPAYAAAAAITTAVGEERKPIPAPTKR